MPRVLLAAASVAAALALLLGSETIDPSLTELAHEIDGSGRLARAIAGEQARPRGELLLARALVAHELDRSWLLSIPESERAAATEASAARLERAAALSRSVFRELPSSWQAAMLVGATTHLDRRRRGDPKFFTRYRDWEAPLELALELGPTQLEPTRYLLAAYLDAWRVLSPRKKELTQEWLATAFADPTSFRTLIQAWLSVAPSIEAGLELVPADTGSWALLQQLFAAQGDWDRYVISHRRRLEAAAFESDRELKALAPASAAAGSASVRHVVRLIGKLPVDLEFAGRLERALAHLPATGSGVIPELRSAASVWLDWALSRARFGEPPLSDRSMALLATHAESEWLRAASALVTGDLAAAEVLERQAYSLYTELWAPYVLLKAELLARRGDGAAARTAIEGLSSAWVDSPHALEVRRLVAELGPDEDAAERAERELRRAAATVWPASAWRPSPRGWRLEILAAEDASAVRLEIETLPRQGAALALLVDGATVGRFGLSSPGSERIEATLDAGLHLIELVRLSAGTITPGELSLI